MGMWDDLKKVAKLSNPVGQTLYAYDKLTGKKPSIKINGQTSEIDGSALDTVNATNAYESGRQKIAADKQFGEDMNADTEAFNKFKSQDMNTEGDLYTPSYKANAKLAKEQEGIISLFNRRKDEILSSRRTPGISQTRF
jgi:hypothetical protein